MRLVVILLLVAVVACGNAGRELHTAEEFAAALEAAGLADGERREKFHGLLGAVDGFGVVVAGHPVEVYEFDTTLAAGSEALEQLRRDGFMGQGVVVNRNLALFKKPKHAHWQQVLAVFESM